MATIDDFEKLGIRVGKILEVEDFPEARKPAYLIFDSCLILNSSKFTVSIITIDCFF